MIWKKDNKLKFIENLVVGSVQELCGKLGNLSTDEIDIKDSRRMQ